MHAAIVQLAPIMGAEKNKAPFYIAGGVLVVWALAVSLGVGLRVSSFPRTVAAQRAVMAVTAVLVALAASMAVITSGSTKAQAPTGAGGGSQASGAGGSPGSASGAGANGGASGSAGAPASLTEAADPSGQLRFQTPTLTARAGRVSIAFANQSPLAHNMTVASGATVLGATPTFNGGTKTLALNLKPGTYKFYCSVPGHREAGMEGTLVVR